ncbi:TcfC E-set like domain-containing protein [Erwinia aphidicola]|uniref:TcfC E-set like domain-containing protein n=1 Tax=Erwinia aphidicola TaxID=68334 RepID=UPI0030D45F44
MDAYRDGQLLSSFYLKAGTRELDTRTFPTGSYAISLRIYENNQLVRTDTVPYTGTGGTALSSFQWFVQAGNVSDDNGSPQRADDDGRRVVQGAAAARNRKCISDSGGSPPQRRPLLGRGRRLGARIQLGARRRHADHARQLSAGQ